MTEAMSLAGGADGSQQPHTIQRAMGVRRLKVSKIGTVTLSVLHRRFKLYVGIAYTGERVAVRVSSDDSEAVAYDSTGAELARYAIDPSKQYLKRAVKLDR